MARDRGRRRGRADTPPPVAKRRPKKPRRLVKVTPLTGAVDPPDGRVRLNRFLASAGICSRRSADDLVRSGRVTIDGEVVTELGTRVDAESQEVRLDGARVTAEKPVYILFNKPKGVVCTNARVEQRRRVIDFLPNVRGRVYTVGRLDLDSEGLILVTNDGNFAQTVTHPRHGISKVYAVLLRGRVRREDVEKARGGVWLAEGRTGASTITVERTSHDRTYLKIALREGRNREIRRVFARLGYPVLALKRIRIGQLNLHRLGSGRYRFLADEEVRELLELARGGAF